MKKLHVAPSFAKKAVAVCLSVAMIVPASAVYLGGSAAQADDALPTPLATFNAGDEGIGNSGENAPSVVETAIDGTDITTAWELQDTIPSTPEDYVIQEQDSSISFANPFAGMADELVEPVNLVERELGTLTVEKYMKPEWNTGITVTYWVKTVDDENNESSIVSFTSNDTKSFNKDDWLKHLLIQGYDPSLETDPTSEFYAGEAVGTRMGGRVLDLRKYADAKGVTDLSSVDAIPSRIYCTSGYTESDWVCYAFNEDGSLPEKFTNDNTKKLADILPYSYKISAESFLDEENNTMRWGYVDGVLQLCASNRMFFSEQVMGRDENPDSGNFGTRQDLNPRNNMWLNGRPSDDVDDGTLAQPTNDAGQWHFVSYVIKNDWIDIYVDGVDFEVMYNNYDDPNTDMDGYVQDQFNLSAKFQDMLYPKAAKPIGEFNPDCRAKTLMEWITMANTELKIGGASLQYDLHQWGAANPTEPLYSKDKHYNLRDTKAGTQVARVTCYAEPLDADQIAAIFEAGDPVRTAGSETEEPSDEPPVTESEEPSAPPVTESEEPSTPPVTESEEPSTPPVTESEEPSAPPVTLGDVSGDSAITADDSLAILKYVVKLQDLKPEQITAADVTGDGKVTTDDALAILKYVVKIITEF